MRISLRLPAAKVVRNFGLTLLTLALLAAALEGVARVAIDTPDAWMMTLHSRRWFARYWQPINSLGFRDREHRDYAQRRVVLVIGDSFGAGHGIKDYRLAIPGLLQQRLGEEWEVFNCARGGMDTGEEIAVLHEVLPRLEKPPAAVVWVYFINDIMGTPTARLATEAEFVQPAGLTARLVDKSYAANYLYWRWYRVRNIDVGRRYWEYPERCWADARIRAEHERQIDELIALLRARDIPLVAALFPHLPAVAETGRITAVVASFLAGRQVPVLDLAPLLAGRAANELTVNSLDPHPNESVHLAVSEALEPLLRRVAGKE